MQGKFFWYDVMTTDPVAARKFYADVIGWGLQDSGTPENSYTLLTAQGRGVAGLMPIPQSAAQMGVRPAWMGYIAVDDVDAMAARVEQEGGKMHRPPIDIPGVIRFAVMADPQGAPFILAKPLSTETPPELAPGTPGTAGWHELYARDWRTAFAFYEKLFGWTKGDAIDIGPMGTYQLFKTGGDQPAGGIMTKPAAIAAPYWSFYFNVTGIDAAAARVTAGGGAIFNGPMQVPSGNWIIQCTDPQGAVFALLSLEK